MIINVDNSRSNPHFSNQVATLSDELASVFSTTKKDSFYEYTGQYSLDILRAIDELYAIEQEGAIGRILKEGVVRKILGFQLAEHEHYITAHNPNGIPQKDFENLQQLFNYIEDNLAKKHSVVSLASIAGMSEKQLRQSFAKLFQKSTIEFITDLRLEKSRELLLDSDKNISEIAYELGFSNSSHFSSLFKKKFERSPKAYQKQFDDKQE